MIEARKVAEVLGGPQILGKRIGSTLDLDEAVAEGLPKSALRNVVRHIFTEPAEQRRAIHRIVPEATFKRRREKLTAVESERTERLARVIASAEYVWGDREGARAFLTAPHWMLRGKSPVQAAATELGAREVEQILAGILHGIPV